MKDSNKYKNSAKKKILNKEEKDLRKNIFYIIFGVLLFGGCYIYYRYNENQLKNEAVITKGILIGIVPGGKSGPDVEFVFWVNGVKKKSMEAFTAKYDSFEYGDTCYVIYARSNPDNCKLEKIEVDGHEILKIKRKIKNSDKPSVLE